MSEPHSTFTRHRFLFEWLYAGLLILLIGGYIIVPLYHDHHRVEAQERARLANQAQQIADNLSHQLKAANLSLESALREIPDWRKQKNWNQLANQHLKALNDAMPGVLTMFIIEANGTISAADKADLVGQNVAKREYFSNVRRYPNSKTLYVSEPFVSTRGNFTMNLARMIPGPDGRFDGMVIAALDPGEYKTLLSSVLYESDMIAFLVHGDGMLFLSVPDNKALVGSEQGKPDSFFTQHLNSGQRLNVFKGKSYALGEDCLVAMASIQPEALAMDKPLVIAVGRNLHAVYSHWNQDAIKNVGLFWIVASLTIIGLYLYQRRRKA